MKKFTQIILKSALLFVISIFSFQTKAQSLTFTTTQGFQCVQGSTVFINASVTNFAPGATSYSWTINTAGNSAWVSWTANGFTATCWGLNLGSTATLTCYAFNVNTGVLITSVTQIITVSSISVVPPLTVAVSSNSFCAGNSVTLTPTSGNSYLNGSSTPSNVFVVTPTVSTCYTISSVSNNICQAFTVICLTQLPRPNIGISGSNTVCVGSSVTFTANGGSSYTWSPGATSNTINILPTTSGIYSVAASHTLNACTSVATVALNVNTTCAMVWPGDANRDGVVNNTDVFEIGLATGSTGSARSPGGINWVGQLANAWSGNVSTGWNKAHADCNGDGSINSSDLGAISTNFSFTHAFKNNAASGLDLVLSPQQSELYAGLWNVIDLVLSDNGAPQTQLYGVAFDINIDQNMIQTDSLKLVYTPSFLNASNQNLEFQKSLFTNGNLYAASVRTDHNNCGGNGKIAELWLKLKSGLQDGSAFNLAINNGKKVSANGTAANLSSFGNMNLTVSTNATGINSNKVTYGTCRFFPNPANQCIVLSNGSGKNTAYRVLDINGSTIYSGEFTSYKNIDISALNNGIYIVEFISPLGMNIQKLVKE